MSLVNHFSGVVALASLSSWYTLESGAEEEVVEVEEGEEEVQAGQEVTAVILRGQEREGRCSGDRDDVLLLLLFSCSWCMNVAIVSSVSGRLAGTHLVNREKEKRKDEVMPLLKHESNKLTGRVLPRIVSSLRSAAVWSRDLAQQCNRTYPSSLRPSYLTSLRALASFYTLTG